MKNTRGELNTENAIKFGVEHHHKLSDLCKLIHKSYLIPTESQMSRYSQQPLSALSFLPVLHSGA